MNAQDQQTSRRLPRGGTLLAGLFAAHVVLKLALLPSVGHSPLVGDEASYVNGGMALSNLVRDLVGLGPVDTEELRRNLVASGWFTPGMSVLLTPLFLVAPDAPILLVRVYLGVATSLLLLLAMLSVRRTFGDRYAALLLVFPGLVPMWLLFGYTAWGDLTAGLLAVVLVAHLVEIFRRIRSGVSFSVREGAWLGLVGVGVVYLRSPTTLLVGGMFVLVLLAVVLLLRSRERVRGVVALGAAGAVFAVLLAPWSVLASASLDSRVITTTSVHNSRSNTFGEYDRICFGPCDPGSTIWFNPLRYSREVARATGYGEVEVQAEMSAYAQANRTPESYARDVLRDFDNYGGNPAQYVAALMSEEDEGGPVFWFVGVATSVMFFVAVLFLLWALLLATRRSFDSQITSIMIKLAMAALLTQPFVHVSSGRYWTTAAPVAALALGLFLQVRDERRLAVGVAHAHPVVESAADAPSAATVHRGLFLVQLGLAGAAVVVALTVVLLAL